MIYPTDKVELPASLRGYAIWLQVYHASRWQAICQLSPTAARQIKRYIDRHVGVGLRLHIEKL